MKRNHKISNESIGGRGSETIRLSLSIRLFHSSPVCFPVISPSIQLDPICVPISRM
jgi:hypothetical protein